MVREKRAARFQSYSKVLRITARRFVAHFSKSITFISSIADTIDCLCRTEIGGMGLSEVMRAEWALMRSAVKENCFCLFDVTLPRVGEGMGCLPEQAENRRRTRLPEW